MRRAAMRAVKRRVKRPLSRLGAFTAHSGTPLEKAEAAWTRSKKRGGFCV